MKIVVGDGFKEVYKFKNANGKTIDMISYVNGKEIYCSYAFEVYDTKTPARVFEKNGLNYCGKLLKYSKDTLVCVDVDRRPLFFVSKADLLTEKFKVDFLAE